MLVIEETEISQQLDKILDSEEFRRSECLRRLLRFLSDRFVQGTADELKEYAIAIDGLGKPSSYDPKHDSAVRIQVKRLRQKLVDYYRTEGKNDPIVIDLPKGQFKLTHLTRDVAHGRDESSLPIGRDFSHAFPFQHDAHPIGPALTSNTSAWKYAGAFCLFVAILSGMMAWRSNRASAAVSGLSPELNELWMPFLLSNRPLITLIEDPMFVEFHQGRGIYFRDKSINKWEDLPKSPSYLSLRQSLKNADAAPTTYYTTFGEAEASFLLGKFLGPYKGNFSIGKTSEMPWKQLQDNDVLFVGMQNVFFDSQVQAMPVKPQLLPVQAGIQDLHPLSGEPVVYADEYTMAPEEEGVTYALVTRSSGALGESDIESFTSNRAAGYVAAVKAFTDPVTAREIVAKLKQQANGKMPRYFQVLLRVDFKNGVATVTHCVLTRELR